MPYNLVEGFNQGRILRTILAKNEGLIRSAQEGYVDSDGTVQPPSSETITKIKEQFLPTVPDFMDAVNAYLIALNQPPMVKP